MDTTLTVSLGKSISAAEILGDHSAETEPSGSSQTGSKVSTEQASLTKELKAQKSYYAEACQTLQNLITKLNQFYEEIFNGHKEQIARLSVEIAGKILMQKVQDGDYEIEAIVKEALKNAPTRQDLVVHLNPEDLVQFQKAQQADTIGILADIKFVGDSNIGRAECLLESPRGVIESLIDQHLEQVGKALAKVE